MLAMAKKRVSLFSSVVAWHRIPNKLGIDVGRKSVDTTFGSVDTKVRTDKKCGYRDQHRHLAIVGVGRKKSCSVDTTFGSVDTRVRIAKKCGYQGPQTAVVVIFLMSKRRVYECALKAKTAKNQGKRSFYASHG